MNGNFDHLGATRIPIS